MNAAAIVKALVEAKPDADVVIEQVLTPEWEVIGLPHVWIRSFAGNDRDAWDQFDTERRRPRDEQGNALPANWCGMSAKLVGMTMCDEAGTFCNFTEAQVEILGRRNAAALDRCFSVAFRLCGLGANAVETAKKNSSTGPSSSSGLS